MFYNIRALLCLLLLISASRIYAAPPTATESKTAAKKIEWVGWSEDLFQKSKREKKLVILDLEAVWCHWCHVMEEKTYSDPKVIDLIRTHYIAVKVDQDSRPDLSNHYEDYGWPATIVFSPSGEEIVKRSGFIEPANMVSMLEACVQDPTPGPSAAKNVGVQVSDKGVLQKQSRDSLTKNFGEEYDQENVGWGFGHKYLQAESAEWALRLAERGDATAKKRVVDTLNQALKIVDPAWGGFYQYSVNGKWDEPHFEKIMSVQADTMRIYALAYAALGNTEYLKAATGTANYLKNFLTSPDGAFYVSQDADLVQGEHSDTYFKLADAARRAKGIPRIDQHIYARENGWASEALVQLSMASGDSQYLDAATKAIAWIEKNRSLPNGGFRHDNDDKGRLYLGDTLAMGRAYLSLYQATGNRSWLKKAQDAGNFIENKFSYTDSNKKKGGFVTVKANKAALKPTPQRDENVATTRFFNLLYYYTGNQNFQVMADQAMRYLASPSSVERSPAASLLLADDEVSNPPLHLTIVGAKEDGASKALFKAAAAFPSSYKRLEWFDKNEGSMPNADVKYPTTLAKPAAFICTGERCSTPIYDPQKLSTRINSLLASSHP